MHSLDLYKLSSVSKRLFARENLTIEMYFPWKQSVVYKETSLPRTAQISLINPKMSTEQEQVGEIAAVGEQYSYSVSLYS